MSSAGDVVEFQPRRRVLAMWLVGMALFSLGSLAVAVSTGSLVKAAIVFAPSGIFHLVLAFDGAQRRRIRVSMQGVVAMSWLATPVHIDWSQVSSVVFEVRRTTNGPMGVWIIAKAGPARRRIRVRTWDVSLPDRRRIQQAFVAGLTKNARVDLVSKLEQDWEFGRRAMRLGTRPDDA